jgi:hypothetical protein
VTALDEKQLDLFLAEGHIARLACVDDDEWPYVVPVWHEWDRKGFWIVPREKSAWASFLQRRPRCALAIEDGGTPRRIVAQCLARVIEEPNVGGKWVPIAERMATRYLGINGPTYLTPTLNRPRWLIYLEARHIWTWQGSGWARRYTE